MADIAKFIHYAEFVNLRRTSSTQLKAQIEQLFLEKAKHSLISKPLEVNPKFADVAAMDIIVSGKRIFENVEQCDVTSQLSKMKKIEKDKLYRMSDRFRSLKDEAILVLRTTSIDEGVEQCDGWIRSTLEGMAKVFPKLTQSPGPEPPITDVFIQKKSDIKQQLNNFFSNTASRAKTAVIVFYGLYQQEQLRLGDGSSLSLSLFLSEIRDVFHECFGRYLLPFTVDVAYQESSVNTSSFSELATYVNVVSMTYRNKLSLTSQQYKVYLPELQSTTLEHGVTNTNVAQGTSFEENYFSPAEGNSAANYFSSTGAEESCLHVSPSTWSVEELGYDEVDM